MIKIIKKALSILEKKEKKQLQVLVILMVIGAVLEMFSVSLILPLISVAMSPEQIMDNEYVKIFCGLFQISNSESLMMLLIIVLIIAFALKNIYLFFEYAIQIRFSANCKLRIQKELVNKYLHRPYEYFVNISSAEVIRVIFSDVGGAFQVINSLLILLTEVVVAIGLVCTIIVLSPMMACLMVVILGGVTILLVNIVKPYLRKAGTQWQQSYALSNKWVLQAINGIKEIKVAGKEHFFQSKYNEHAEKSVSAEKRNSLMSHVPRMLLETVCVCGILLVLFILICVGNDMESLIPQLTALAVAAIRLLPGVNRINASFNTISYQSPAVDKTIENLQRVENWELVDGDVMAQKPEIKMQEECSLSKITYSYANSEKVILKDADMLIPVGKAIGVVGASGAGKTTAIDILLGVLFPQEGRITVDGIDISDNYEMWHKCVGYIPQMIFLMDDTIRANVAFGQNEDTIDDKAVWDALDEAQLGDFVREMPNGLDTMIGERGLRLSGGQRQRIGIARALYADSPLLVFDEATSALDNETEAAIMEAINRLHGKKTMVIIAHRLQTIKNCDIVYRVENEKIVRER